MKKRNLLKFALLTLAALPMGTWAIDFETEATVTTTTDWIFNDQSESISQISQIGTTGLYARANSSRGVFSFEGSSVSSVTFDGHVISSITKCLTITSKGNRNVGSFPGTAGTISASGASATDNVGVPYLAFNAAVPGTLYVYVSKPVKGKEGDNEANAEIRFYNGTTTSQVATHSTTGNGEMKCTTTTDGVFFIGATANSFGSFNIYAVRFVPLTDEITIGTTGYATYSNNNKCALSLQDGLTAYSAAAGDDGHSVTLTAVSQMRPTSGYVVKGTPGDTYTLTAAVDQKKSADGPGSMKRAAAYSSSSYVIPATDGANYNYLLGNDSGTAKFFAPNGTSALNVKKAFLQVDTELTASARGIDIIIEDGTTGIMQITKSKYGADEYFNLSGQRVANPTKGLYIVNGKKVIVK